MNLLYNINIINLLKIELGEVIMDKVLIRNANYEDLDRLVEIEGICFPAAEAAKRDSIEERLRVYNKGFFVIEKDCELVGFINGGAFEEDTIRDEFFESMDLHDDNNPNLMIFGLDVLPDYQGHDFGKSLMERFIEFARTENKKAILLTCKDHLIHYYSRFGYENLGVADSAHGGAKWYDMRMKL
jgi:ribosomal protein S18 acetylase RimI-like enzyme